MSRIFPLLNIIATVTSKYFLQVENSLLPRHILQFEPVVWWWATWIQRKGWWISVERRFSRWRREMVAWTSGYFSKRFVWGRQTGVNKPEGGWLQKRLLSVLHGSCLLGYIPFPPVFTYISIVLWRWDVIKSGGSSFVWWPKFGLLVVVSLAAVAASSMEFGVLEFSQFFGFFWACFLLGSVKLRLFGF